MSTKIVIKLRNVSSELEDDFMISHIWKIVLLRDIIHENAMRIGAAGTF